MDASGPALDFGLMTRNKPRADWPCYEVKKMEMGIKNNLSKVGPQLAPLLSLLLSCVFARASRERERDRETEPGIQ